MKEKRAMLYWQEAEKIFRSYGIELTKSTPFRNLAEVERQKNYFSLRSQNRRPENYPPLGQKSRDARYSK